MACSGASCSGTSYKVSDCNNGTCTASGYNGCAGACQGTAHGNCSNSCTGCTSSCGYSCSGSSSGSGGGGSSCSTCTGGNGSTSCSTCTGGSGSSSCTTCTGCGSSCQTDCTGCTGTCIGSCDYNCSGCDGTCTNDCNESCGSLCSGGLKISIRNLALEEYMKAQNIEDIYNAAIYETNRRSYNQKSEIDISQYSSINATLMNDILAMINNLGTSLTSVSKGINTSKILGNNIIDVIKNAWEQEI